MTVQDYITAFNLEHEHVYTNPTLLKYINLVESNLDIVKQYLNAYYSRTLNAFQFALPSGVDFEDVYKLYVNGIPYKKKDTRAYKESRSYWYEGGKLCIYPACSETDTSYVSGANEITFSSATITTTGDDFVGFSIGDVISVSGCLLNTANNKTVTIIGVAAKVLTFASGTFTAQAEAAVITISRPRIKLTYLSKPTTKLIANIATDTLMLDNKWQEIYDYFILSKIAYNAKDYSEAQNHLTYCNAKIRDFEEWYETHRAMKPETDIIASYDDCSNSTDFDNE